MIKSNPIITRWVTHRLEKNNTKEILTLLWRFWSLHQTSQHGNLSKGLRIPKNLALRASRSYYRPSRGLRETDCSLGGHKQNFAYTKTQRRAMLTPQDTEPKLPASVRGAPAEVWIGRGSPQGQGHWEVLIDIDPRAGLPQAKQLLGRGRVCNPTHQQIIGLNLYWARLCPPEQDPVFPITSPSHQEEN